MKYATFACIIFLGALSCMGQNLLEGLEAHWPLDEGQHDCLADHGPHHLDGFLNNGQWVKGPFGNAVKFLGSNSFATLPTPAFLKGADEMSLSLWATWEGSGNYPCLISSGWNPGGLMIFVSNNFCSFRLGRPGHTASEPGNQWRETSVAFLNPIPFRKWVHLAVVFKRPRVTAYVDGIPTGTATWDDCIQPADTITMGHIWNAKCHEGLLSDFRLYSRALSAEEIALLADRKGRETAQYQFQDMKDAAIVSTLETRCATFTFGANNTILSIRQKSPERELLKAPCALVGLTLEGGMRRTASRLSSDGDNGFTATFTGLEGNVSLRIESKGDYVVLTPLSVSIPNVKSLAFCHLQAAMDKYCGRMAGLLSDDESGLGLRSLSLKVLVETDDKTASMTASAAALHGLTDGVAAAIAAGPRSELPAIYKAMEANEPVPKSAHGGVQALESNLTRGSYLFADLDTRNTDDWLAIARRGGFSFLHFYHWWNTLGHYDINKGKFPNGLSDMKACVDKIHAAGLKASFHTLTACIDVTDKWVTPEPSDDLITSVDYTLAQPFSETDTTLYVNEMPIQEHDIVWSYSCRGNAMKIGKEIIQYTEISREKPYAFKNCTRGAFGTRAASHAAGEKAGYLQQLYLAFYPKPDSPLADELADAIANVYNQTGMDGLYFDGSEGMGSHYGIDTMRWKIFQRLKGDVVAEASSWDHNNWWFHSRLGAWDHPYWAARRTVDAHIKQAKEFRMSNLLQPQLGWWAPVGPSASWPAQHVDEIEYFACKNLAMDAPMSLQGITAGASPWNARLPEMLTILGWYERLRMANYFETKDLEQLLTPGADFRLRLDDEGHWKLAPVLLSQRRTVGSNDADPEIQGICNQNWAMDNPQGEQPFRARVEALYSAKPADESGGKHILVDFSDLRSLSAKRSAQFVAQQLLLEEQDTRLADKNLRIVATNSGETAEGAWAMVSRDYPHPYLNMEPGRAFGLWIKGDGSGALLNLQVQTPNVYHGAISDHYVTLDFTGWRYVELLLRERDAQRMADYAWPYSVYAGSYAICRNTIYPNALSKISIYLNNIPAHGQTDVVISPVLARPLAQNEIRNVSLSVNGKTVQLPVSMDSGHYLELEGEHDCSHYNESGLLLERFTPVCPDGWPVLLAGANDLSIHAESADPKINTRLDVVAKSIGKPFGTRSKNVDWKWLDVDYDMPRVIFKQDGIDNAWSIWQRDEGGDSPNDQASLSFELQVSATEDIRKSYENPDLAKTLDNCSNPLEYNASEFNDYAKFAFDSENQNTAKSGVAFSIKHVPSDKSTDGALLFEASSKRADSFGWAAIGRRFQTPVDISGAASLTFWLKGDNSGAAFKVQLRDINGKWHDMVTPVTFTGWKFIEFPLDGVKLDPKEIAYILYYYNNLPMGRSIADASTEGTPVSCVVDDVRFIYNKNTLDTPVFTVNGQSVRFPVSLHAGQTLNCDGEGRWRVSDASRSIVAEGRLESPMPRLKSGRNDALLSFLHGGEDTFRVTVSTIKSF